MQRFTVTAILAVLCLNAFARNYDYSENNPFYLSSGLDPFDLSRVRQPCIKYQSEARLDGSGTTGLRLQIKTVKNQKDLFSELGISANIAAQGFFGGAEGGSSFASKTQFFEDSITLLIIGKVSFGRFAMVAPVIMDPFLLMLQAGNYTQFAKRCGTNYIALERRGSTVFAIYTFHNLTQKQKTEIEAFAKGGGSFGSFSGQADSSASAAWGQAAASTQVEFDLVATGGGGLQIISSLVRDPSNIEEVKQKIADYLNSMTIENAVPTGYIAGSMADFGWEEPTPIDLSRRDRVLTESYFLINELDNARHRLSRIISGRKTAFSFLEDQDIELYRNAKNERTRIIDEAYTSASACYRRFEDCKMPNYDLEPIIWPIERLDRCESLRLRAMELGFIDASKMANYRNADLVPFFDEENKELLHVMSCKEFLKSNGGIQ